MDRSDIKGTFIVFEGLDGCGKTTQAQLLADFFAGQGAEYVYVREPGGTPVGDKLRAILLDPETVLTKWGEVLLLAAARAQLVQDIILPALTRGKTVICDRYLFSSVAYQGYGLEQDVELVKRVNLEAVQGLMPDMTFYLEVSVQTGLARQQKVRRLDRIERRDSGFFSRVVRGYEKMISEYNFIRLDGTAEPQVIHRQVVDNVTKKMKKGERG
ncbi:MAG: dTMP kinase [Firmicutes bacterium]|nr:dTMP kinase [Bacillota bacterium]HOB35674.1 dTMP kinase [Bacillota bacterium]HPZ91291.1 dTMP kinase [Bacillota bacterium]HQE02458.1 dTMP kinase [Bacillota bacterium]